MASLLNNASLLLNPAGSVIAYEEDKIFSVLPTNGDGDFTFTGGNGGTRVNQEGYIEQTPANLITYSEDFSNAAWTKVQTPVMAYNIAIAPNGTLTADSIQANTRTLYQTVNQSKTCAPNSTFTFSYYIKKETTKTYFSGTYLYFTGGTYKITYVTFDEVTGAYNFISGGTVSLTVNVENQGDWWRLSISGTDTGNNTNIEVAVYGTLSQNGTTLSPGIGSARTIWGAMLNQGSTAKPYQPTTDRLNYPRITYQNGRGALLSEPQRTNLLTYSEQLDNAAWSSNGLIITANQGISPDGTQNADLLDDGTASSTQHWIYKGISFSYSTTYTISFYAKYISRKYIAVNIYNGSTSQYVVYDIQNGSVYGSTGDVTASITSVGNGWYRIVYTRTIAASGSPNFRIALADDTGSVTYTGNNKQVYVWGCQIEAGSYPTSYIPTTTATVTRPGETYPQNTTSFQTTGVSSNGAWSLILEGSETALNAQGFQLYSGGTYLGGHYGATYIYKTSANTEAYPFQLTQPRFRIGLSWNGTTLVIYQNGIQVLSTTNVLSAYNTFSKLYLNTGASSKISYPKAAVYNTALSATQLEELTTINSGSGGTISYYGPYTIHTFTGSGTFTPSFNGQVEVLVVAGGGAGGGGDVGGGGGAGGLLYVSSYGVSSGTGITVTIGAGGAGVQNASLAGGNGSNSVFGGLTAIGGGGGAGWVKGTGNDGGSGGGATYYGVGGQGIDGQGNDGGTGGILGPPYPQCGGGGAGEAGFPAQSSTVAGNGGDGLPYSISGFSTYYAGGGGGATEGSPSVPGTPGTGGLGGGGNGGSQGASILGTPGVNGLGGGGGGCDPQAGANGGSGIVIVRYLT